MKIIQRSRNHSGRYILEGTGISVQSLVVWVKNGRSPQQLAREYELTLGEVAEALAFYIQNQSEIDRDIALNEEFAEWRKQKNED